MRKGVVGEQQEERQRERGYNLKLPEASGTLVTSTENGPITDDAFDRGRVFNYAPQERGNSFGQGSSLMDRPAMRGGRLSSSFLTPCVRTCSPGRVPL